VNILFGRLLGRTAKRKRMTRYCDDILSKSFRLLPGTTSIDSWYDTQSRWMKLPTVPCLSAARALRKPSLPLAPVAGRAKTATTRDAIFVRLMR
jgi:hypothetical protein